MNTPLSTTRFFSGAAALGLAALVTTVGCTGAGAGGDGVTAPSTTEDPAVGTGGGGTVDPTAPAASPGEGSEPVDTFPYVTDYSSRRAAGGTLPAKFGSYVDPTFGSKLIRVTDSGDGTSCINAYSYWPAFNSDSTRLLIACDGVSQLYKFDPSTDTLSNDGPLVTAGGPRLQFEGAFWSHSEPSVLYALGGTKLYRVDTAQTGAARFTMIRDFAGTFNYAFSAHQLGKSDDDNVFTFSSRVDSTSNGVDVAVYKRDTNQVFTFPRPSGFLPDESQMSKDGAHVIIPSRDASRTWCIWTWATGKVDLLPWNATARPGGHYDAGRTKLVNGDNWQDGFQTRDWVAPGSSAPRNIFQFFASDGKSLNWDVGNHVSMRADDESFAIASTYGATGTGQPFEREIVLVRTDGSGFVRLGHTLGTRGDYYSEPRAVVDRLGRYVVFTSDLGSSSRLDVMILKIPRKFAGR